MPMEASLAVPQRKAMSSTMKMMKMESMAIASAYGWGADGGVSGCGWEGGREDVRIHPRLLRGRVN